ncbi:MAG: hypothetical protein V1744_08655 [Candidatus Altiarchaeota archaeon]
MRSSRGQSAVEYLLTYGWALIVILVVGVVVWQLGFLELGRNVTPDKRGFSQVTPLDWGMSQTGVLSVVVQNNAGTLVDLDASGTIAKVTVGFSGDGSCDPLVGSIPPGFRPGATTTITFTGCKLASNAEIGNYYKVDLTIAYANPASGLDHASNGVIWGPIG